MQPHAADLMDLERTVHHALQEDVGSGDWTAQLTANEPATAQVLSRDAATFCGRAWVDEVFRQLDPGVTVDWQVFDGASVSANTVLFRVRGPARALLTGERTALNFLQTLSGTATTVARYVAAVAGSDCQIVDTRKTLPGLRRAQKYAVRCGGGVNHRIGLFDGILIKENHVVAAGGLRPAIQAARALNASVPLMAEAETLEEAAVALAEDIDLLLVDDVPLEALREAVRMTRAHRAAGGRTMLEYSGGATLATVRAYADCGVDRVSVGSLTKHVQAVDLSMRFDAR